MSAEYAFDRIIDEALIGVLLGAEVTGAHLDYWPRQRIVDRVTIVGDKPFR